MVQLSNKTLIRILSLTAAGGLSPRFRCLIQATIEFEFLQENLHTGTGTSPGEGGLSGIFFIKLSSLMREPG